MQSLAVEHRPDERRGQREYEVQQRRDVLQRVATPRTEVGRRLPGDVKDAGRDRRHYRVQRFVQPVGNRLTAGQAIEEVDPPTLRPRVQDEVAEDEPEQHSLDRMPLQDLRSWDRTLKRCHRRFHG